MKIKDVCLGKAKSKNITVVCCLCQQAYTMLCEEFAMKMHGAFIKQSIGADDWVCPKCAEEIIKIKNL